MNNRIFVDEDIVEEIRKGAEKEREDKWNELCDHVDKLNALLKDPHPGLFTWCEFYAKHMQFISNYWTGDKED